MTYYIFWHSGCCNMPKTCYLQKYTISETYLYENGFKVGNVNIDFE